MLYSCSRSTLLSCASTAVANLGRQVRRADNEVIRERRQRYDGQDTNPGRAAIEPNLQARPHREPSTMLDVSHLTPKRSSTMRVSVEEKARPARAGLAEDRVRMTPRAEPLITSAHRKESCTAGTGAKRDDGGGVSSTQLQVTTHSHSLKYLLDVKDEQVALIL